MKYGYPAYHAFARVCGLVLTGCLLLVGSSMAEPLVERISFAPRADGLGYVVRIHASERVLAYSEPRFVDENELEFVIFNASAARGCVRDDPQGPVQAYSLRERKGHLYFTFQLDRGVDVNATAYRDRNSTDLLLGLRSLPRTPAADPIPTRPVAMRTPPASQRPASPSPDDARARWKLDTIVIDAGHGGHDTGALGPGGAREKDVVLAVALKLGTYLEELLGVDVVYTRRDDRFITLRERGKIANREGAKLFVSIHANASRNRSATGAETYFLGMHKTDAARKVMERENSVVKLEEDPGAYASLNEQALIRQTLAQSAYMRKSEQLADLIQHQFTDRVGRKSRGVKQAGFYVLWSASMPSILVELGFITNPREAAFLQSEQGQDYLASAIFRAVREFKTRYEEDLDLVAR